MILLAAMLIGQSGIGPNECQRPSADDARPYTLCLAETANDEVERRLKQQLASTLAHVRASKGAGAALRLRLEQRQWDRERRHSCAAEAGEAAISEQARAELTCLTMAAEPRLARLALIASAR